MVNADFRAAFPEFASTVNYPDSQLNFWASVAEKMLPEEVWLDMYENAVYLYVAHEITLARQNAAAAAVGGTPGQSGGPPASKAVGSVSVSYDSANTAEKNAGWWNLTTYGKQLFRLIKIFGAGCIQL